MIYQFGRYAVRFSIRQFFRSIKLSGAEPCERGAVLFVSNHPNFALDSLVVQTVLRRELWFLAKSTLFQNSFLKWFLSECHLIPVYRRQDNPSEMGKNLETFKIAAGTLEQGLAVVIFPEGVSKGERRLSPLKTGAARIAFQSEAANEFRLGLKIQAIGLTYTDLKKFKSSVTVCFGDSISISDFADRYHKNAVETVELLTAQIEESLRKVTVEVPKAEHESLVERIGKLYESRSPAREDRERFQIIARNVEALAPQSPEFRTEIEQRLDFYFDMTRIFGLEEGDSLVAQSSSSYLVLLAPFLLLGAFLHYLPYRLISLLVSRITSHPVDIASYKFGLGCLLFPSWCVLLGIAADIAGASIEQVLCVIVFAVLSAICVNRYLAEFRMFLLSSLWPGGRKPSEMLRMLRDSLIADLERVRVQ